MTQPWYETPATSPDQASFEQAQQHQQQLTKPFGSLGELETIAMQFCAWQQTERPVCDNVVVRIFAGDHGICEAKTYPDGSLKPGVSAYPQSVTAQMIHNFLNGGAAISVLSKQINADFAVVNMGTVEPITVEAAHFVNHQLMNGTHNFTRQAAMSKSVLEQALSAGQDEVNGAISNNKPDLLIAGEMGIGNTTSASAIYCLLLKMGPEAIVGSGTGVDKEGMMIKRKAIYQAMNCHGDSLSTPLSILQCVGGLEIAALVGAYIAAAQHSVPILVDGFICTAAALLAVKINPSVRDWMLFAHQSAERGHALALENLKAAPLLKLNMRLGEASGAALAVPLIQSALTLHKHMATFDQAKVSERI